MFANRHVLRMSSQVLDFQLHKVLCSMQEIPLPSTSADDMAVLMQAIHPPMTPVTGESSHLWGSTLSTARLSGESKTKGRAG